MLHSDGDSPSAEGRRLAATHCPDIGCVSLRGGDERDLLRIPLALKDFCTTHMYPWQDPLLAVLSGIPDEHDGRLTGLVRSLGSRLP